MNLSQHFHLDEFTVSHLAAHYGLINQPDNEARQNLRHLAQVLEVVRNELGGHPIIITSGYRCRPLNLMIGGAKNSAHTFGMAADFICPGYGNPLQICNRLVAAGIEFDQLILEPGWVHLAIAQEPRCQVLTAAPGGKYIPGLPGKEVA